MTAPEPTACTYRPHSRPEGTEPYDCQERIDAVTEHNRAQYGNDPAHCRDCSAAVQEWVTWPCPASQVTAPDPSTETEQGGGQSAESEAGAWLVYDDDHGPYAISLHDSAPKAAREAARQGYGKVAFWPFDFEMADAVKEWERPDREPSDDRA